MTHLNDINIDIDVPSLKIDFKKLSAIQQIIPLLKKTKIPQFIYLIKMHLHQIEKLIK